MINIVDKKNCVGCNACMQICPRSCIQMKEDFEGFLYPKIDQNRCIDCSLCEKVCPVIHQNPHLNQNPQCFAAKNKNEEIRMQSSSGGVFTLLAESIIEQGGVVFGARFDNNWEVVHDYTETKKGLAAFRGSKYVQSRIEDNFLKVRNFLKAGRKVFFSGTPCQVAGLKRFLRKEYDNLLCVDFVCHGVPSPKVWELYKNEILQNQESQDIKSLTFRDKSSGWKTYSFKMDLAKGSFKQLASQNIYMRGFLKDLYLRPSCYECPFKNHKSGADLTIADFWGIENHYPDFDDDKGVSLVMLMTDKGKYINSLVFNGLEIFEVDYDMALQGNPSIEKSVGLNLKKEIFFQSLDRSSCSNLIYSHTKTSRKSLLKLKLHLLAKQIGLLLIIRKLR